MVCRTKSVLFSSLIIGLLTSSVLEGCISNAEKPWIYTETKSDLTLNATIDLRKHKREFSAISHFTIYREVKGERDPRPVLASYPERPAWVRQSEHYELREQQIPSIFQLSAGRYYIDSRINTHHGQDPSNGTRLIGWVQLKPGHYYVLRVRRCYFCKKFMARYAATWIEDEATGEILIGSKSYPEEK